MTKWEKFIEQHDFQFFNFNIAAEEINKKDFDWLKKECAKAKKKGVPFNNTLIGHIKEEYKMPGISKSLHNYLCSVASTHKNFEFFNKRLNILSENRPLYLHSFWVNYQKKHEFNPVHNHSGVLSFIVFIQIPYLIKDQDKISPGKYSNGNRAGRLAFLEITPTGRIEHKVFDVDKTWEQSVLIFPAELNHIVYPFYKVNKPRITISGNIRYKV